MTNERNLVACPQCRKRGPWTEGPWKPFCSERCRLIDLGSWFDENNRISEPLRPKHFLEFEQLPPDIDPDNPAD